jgi:peptide/nickel transport system permease protein
MRILWVVPIILAVSLIVYTLMDLAPGNVVESMITDEMTQEDIAALRAQYDLDKPMLYRYGKYMFHLVQGDLGVSDTTKFSVWDTFMQRLPNTLILALASFIFGSVFAIFLGIFAARHSGTLLDNATTLFTMVGMSMPNFWLGLQLVLLFSLRLGLLPAGGREGPRSILLPAICAGIGLMAQGTRQTRSSMLEVLRADYLRTARAKGVPEDAVIRKHALGNAWIPILTTFGGTLCHSIAGSAVIESVFAWPGVGLTIVNAVRQRDVSMALGCVIMTTFMYVILMLCVDLMYAFVDPRIKSRFVNTYKRKRQ